MKLTLKRTSGSRWGDMGIDGDTHRLGARRGGLLRGRNRVVVSLAAVAATVAGIVPMVVAPSPAGASGTPLIEESFANSNVSSPSSWVKPAAPVGVGTGVNGACLTAGAATSQTPIPDCSSPAVDPSGSGVLRLTNTGTQQEGGAMTSLSVPASKGLDANFDSYQWGGAGADGIGFVIAAENPSDPAAPAQMGQPGGDLGYSAGGQSGLTDGYLGVGLDVWGNYSNPVFDGTGCTNPTWAGYNGGQVVVRGPGTGTAGYCLLDSSASAYPSTKQDLHGTSRSGSQVPVEVVLNTTGSAVPMSNPAFSSDSVPAGDYGVAWTPVGGSPKFYTGALPSTSNGGLPSALYPSGWVNPATGIPYQLGFGWVGSTGATTDYHEVSNVSVATAQQVPVLGAAISDSHGGQLQVGGSVDYSLQASVTTAGGNENDAIAMVATLPTGVTPGSATGTNWTCETFGQVVLCGYTGSLPITPGTALPPVSLPATVAAGLTIGSALDSTLKVSSDDGSPASASDNGTATPPPALTSLTLSANPSPAAAGIGTIALDNNGALPTETQQSQVSGTVGGGSNSTANNQVAELAVGDVNLKAINLKAIDLGTVNLKAINLKAIAVGTDFPGQDPLSSVLLSNINVTYPDGCDPTQPPGGTNACTGWYGILEGSQYAPYPLSSSSEWPLQSVTLGDVFNTTGSDQPDGLNPEERLDSLTLSDIDLSGSSLGSIPLTAYALGNESISDVPLNSNDLSTSNGNSAAFNTVSDWCTQMGALNLPRLTCSALGIDPSNPSTYQDVTPLALGVLGVPLASLSLTSVPVTQTMVDGSPLDAINLKAINLKAIDLGAINLKAINLKAIDLGTVNLKAINLKAIDLGTVNLKAINLKAIDLGAANLKAINLKAIDLGTANLKAINLKAIGLGSTDLSDVDLGTDANSVNLKSIDVKNISDPSQIVNCAVVNCGATSTATLGSAWPNNLATGATLGLLQQDVGSDPAFTQTTLAELYAALDATALANDTTTLAELYAALDATATANDTTTLAQLYAALDATATADDTTTLADIYSNLNSAGEAQDTTTLAELYAAIDPSDDSTTLGQLIDDLAQNDPSVLSGLYLGDLVAGLIPESTYPWQSVDLSTPGLAEASTGGGRMTLTASSAVSAGGPQVVYTFTLPAGFSYVPGSATFDGAAQPDPTVSGDTVTSALMTTTGSDAYAITVAPGESLGQQTPSVTASLATGSTMSASTNVNVTDPFATSNSSSPATLTPDSMNVSFLASPASSAYWSITVPTAGDELSLDLSNLPADYDMVLYGTSSASLSGAPTGGTDETTETPPSDQSAVGQQTDPDQGNLPLLGLPIEAIAATRGTADKQISTPPLAAGVYTVQISGYNGAYDTLQPYVLRDELTPTSPGPSCAVPATYANDALTQNVSLPTSYPQGVNTLFLVDPDRLYDAYGQAATDTVMSELNTITSQHVNGMIGAVVPVEGSAQTANDYHTWDQNPCSVSAANTVVSDITSTVQSIEAQYPTVRYVVVVGADDQVPFARVPDMTPSDNESDFAAGEFQGINDQLSAALSQGYFLSDDPYGSPTPLSVGGQVLYTPSLAIGRLVETPTEIVNALSRYVSSGGALNASTGLSTGYDFLTQGADAISKALQQNGESVTNVISDTWNANDLTNALSGTYQGENGLANVISLNAHFDFGRLLTAEGDQPNNNDPTQVVDTQTVRQATAPATSGGNDLLSGSVLFSMGCHSGLNIPANEIENDVPGGLDDWTKVFADEGALWVGNTGYGYANDQYIAYSAKLTGLFASDLNGSLSLGEALAQAKQLYAGQSGTLDPYDLKALMESTFYGIPNYTLNVANPSSTSSGSLPQLQLGSDPSTGLTTDSFSISQLPGSQPQQLGTVTPPEGGTYYEVNDSTLEETAAGFPIEPLNSVDVTDPGSTAHGALITGLSSLDYGDFDPSISNGDSDVSGNENQIPELETAFPATLQRIGTYDLFDPSNGNPVQHQAVDVITGQFIPNPTSPTQGEQRLFTGVNGSVEYTAPGDTQFTPPTIDQSEGIVTSGSNPQAEFSVDATSPVPGTTVKEVLVLFKDTTDGGDTSTSPPRPVAWTPVWLTQGSDGTWSGGATAPASGQISYIVQAVDSDGNVAMASNKGVDFNQVPAAQSTGSGLQAAVTSGGTPTNGYYTTSPLTETITGPAPGTPITYSVDDGDTTTSGSPVNIDLTGDGTHRITASDSDGDTTTQTIGIETQNPTIDAQISAPQSANGWTGAGTRLAISASDASGISSLSYTVTPQGGSPGPTQTVNGSSTTIDPPSGTTLYSVTATSFAGHTATRSITTNVQTAGPTVTCGASDGNWHDTNQTVQCTGSGDPAGIVPPNPVSLSTSVPPGGSNADASTGTAKMCDSLGNCTTAGPVGGFMIDMTSPSLSVTANAPNTASNGWESPGTIVTASASDAVSGIASVTYTVTPQGGHAGPPQTYTGPFTVANGVNTYRFTATSVAGDTATQSVTTMVDSAAPVVSCPAAPSGWFTTNQSVTCTVSAGGPSGLATPTRVSLSTSVAPNTSNANASTGTASACSNINVCTTVGPVSGFKIDLTGPAITLSGVTNNQSFIIGQPAKATYSCTDTSGSGIASCSAKVNGSAFASGATLPASAVGVDTLTVTATSVSGATVTQSVTYDVTYNICRFIGPIELRGSLVTFVVTLCNYTGGNVGGAGTTITAVNVDGTITPKGVPNNKFVFVSGFKVYEFTLSSTGLPKGTHTLNVSVSGDPLGHSLTFKLT